MKMDMLRDRLQFRRLVHHLALGSAPAPSCMIPLIQVGLAGLLLVTAPPMVRATDPAIGVTSSAAPEEARPLYMPPRKLVPRARVGGTLRGTDGNDPEIQALVPDHVGLTVNRTPVLNWFLSKTTSYPIRFTLIDNRSIKPLHEAPLPPPTHAGFQAIRLNDLGLSLEPDVQYRWYVSVVRNPDSPSQDIVAGGVIERCEFTACLVEARPQLTCSTQSVVDNAHQGFWYDAMACLCTLIDTSPTSAPLRRMRAALLKQVGLHGVAEWDLQSLSTSGR